MEPANSVDMRHLTTLALVLALAGTAAADDRALTSQDVVAQLKPVSPDIERCYMDRTADVHGAGHLALVLTVSRHGIVEQVAVQTPGVAPKIAKQIDSCVRERIATISFPAKRTPTTATVPYFFQRTAAPNAGPQLSCWDPAGCHGK
jgi:hypothetical protein